MTADGTLQILFYLALLAAVTPLLGGYIARVFEGERTLLTPELGLSNWQGGRLLARGGVLAGDSVHTVRLRATVRNHDLHR